MTADARLFRARAEFFGHGATACREFQATEGWADESDASHTVSADGFTMDPRPTTKDALVPGFPAGKAVGN